MDNKINPLWSAYNNLQNEGGEGYNPHQKYLSSGSGEPEWSKLDDKIYRTLRIMNATSDASPRYKELQAELDALQAAYKIAKEANI